MPLISAPYRVPVFLALTVTAVALNYFLGKDMASDALHYHLYAGFSALNDRFERDYFAAGLQSYFNPYAYAPFYVLVKLGLPGLAVSTVLAIVHSAALWITYELACCVCPSENRKERLYFGVCATVLALMNPVMLQQIGSSFADITTTGFVLGGWLLLAKTVLRPSYKLVIFSAAALGMATALKPTNAVHALAGFIVLAFVPLPTAGRIKSFACFGASLAVSFALTSAPWSYRLARMFGNPVFPLLNGIFKSPEFTTAFSRHYRFIPDTWGDALLRPFTMVDAAPMIHDEMSAPDIRYALLLSVFLIFIISRIWQSTPQAAVPAPISALVSASKSAARPEARVLTALGCGLVVDWIIWLDGSGNSRYFMPMACVAGVVAVALLFRLLVSHTTGRNLILLALFAAQTAQLSLGTQFRWNESPWDGLWFNVNIPDKLANEPNLYLSIGMQSNSFIIPFLAKGSGIINISGGYPLGPDGANAPRVRRLINQRGPHLRVLVSGEWIYQESALKEPRQSDIDDALRAFGLRTDMSDCETISVQGLKPQVEQALDSSIPSEVAAPTRRYQSYLVSCHVMPDSRDQSQEIAARRAADVVLNRLEDACPALFQPTRSQTAHQNQVWLRTYPQTDLTAWISKGQLKFIDPMRNRQEIVVGSQEEWAKAPLSLDCGRRHGTYFAKVVQAEQ